MGDIQYFAWDMKTALMTQVTLREWYAASTDLSYPRVRVTDDANGSTGSVIVRGSVAGVLEYHRQYGCGLPLTDAVTDAESGYTVAHCRSVG